MFGKPALPTDFCCLGNNLLGDTAVVLLYATCDGAGLSIEVASVIELSEASGRVAAGLFMTEG